jgi:hypothetical protein
MRVRVVIDTDKQTIYEFGENISAENGIELVIQNHDGKPVLQVNDERRFSRAFKLQDKKPFETGVSKLQLANSLSGNGSMVCIPVVLADEIF